MKYIESITENLTSSEEVVVKWLLDNLMKSHSYVFRFKLDTALKTVFVSKPIFMSALTKLKIAEIIQSNSINNTYITVSVFAKGTFHSLVKALGVR